MQKRRTSITDLARELRRNPTKSEELLWEQLRKRRLDGYRFVRQKQLIYRQNKSRTWFFIADFYCSEKKLVLELDGSIHAYQHRYDYRRDLVLSELGLNTLRIANDELHDLEQVKRKILKYLE